MLTLLFLLWMLSREQNATFFSHLQDIGIKINGIDANVAFSLAQKGKFVAALVQFLHIYYSSSEN